MKEGGWLGEAGAAAGGGTAGAARLSPACSDWFCSFGPSREPPYLLKGCCSGWAAELRDSVLSGVSSSAGPGAQQVAAGSRYPSLPHVRINRILPMQILPRWVSQCFTSLTVFLLPLWCWWVLQHLSLCVSPSPAALLMFHVGGSRSWRQEREHHRGGTFGVWLSRAISTSTQTAITEVIAVSQGNLICLPASPPNLLSSHLASSSPRETLLLGGTSQPVKHPTREAGFCKRLTRNVAPSHPLLLGAFSSTRLFFALLPFFCCC